MKYYIYTSNLSGIMYFKNVLFILFVLLFQLHRVDTIKCDAGSYLLTNDCMLCPSGKFRNNTQDQSTCYLCELPSHTDGAAGSTDCSLCKDSTYLELSTKTCKPCKPNETQVPNHYWFCPSQAGTPADFWKNEITCGDNSTSKNGKCNLECDNKQVSKNNQCEDKQTCTGRQYIKENTCIDDPFFVTRIPFCYPSIETGKIQYNTERYSELPACKNCTGYDSINTLNMKDTWLKNWEMGNISIQENMTCQYECNSGYILDETNNLECKACSAGTYDTGGEMKYCDICEPGTFSMSGSSVCSDCVEGKFSNEESGICEDCCDLNFDYDETHRCNPKELYLTMKCGVRTTKINTKNCNGFADHSEDLTRWSIFGKQHCEMSCDPGKYLNPNMALCSSCPETGNYTQWDKDEICLPICNTGFWAQENPDSTVTNLKIYYKCTKCKTEIFFDKNSGANFFYDETTCHGKHDSEIKHCDHRRNSYQIGDYQDGDTICKFKCIEQTGNFFFLNILESISVLRVNKIDIEQQLNDFAINISMETFEGCIRYYVSTVKTYIVLVIIELATVVLAVDFLRYVCL